MKRILIVMLITSMIMLLLLGAGAVLVYRSENEKKIANEDMRKEELDLQLQGQVKESIRDDEVIPLYLTGENKNVETYPHKTAKEIYDVEQSRQIKEALERLKRKNKYAVENCLWAYNPYGTHDLSLYLYFEAREVVTLRYTIHIEDEDTPDFTRTARVSDEIAGTKEVECVISGLVPEKENFIILKLMNGSGKVVKRMVYSITPGRVSAGVQKQLIVQDGNSLAELSNGLYVFLGHDAENKNMEPGIYLYDNSGLLRGIIPTVSGRTTRLLQINGQLFYNFSNTSFASVAPSGQVMQIYRLKGYYTVNDFTYDGYGDILTIATRKKAKTIEDQIVSLNLESGETRPLLDMGSVLGEVREKTGNKRNWIGLNSISWEGRDSVLVSARELSGILKLRNISSVAPSVEYIIGEQALWEEQGRTEGVLTPYVSEDAQEGALTRQSFESQYGQSTVSKSFVEEGYPMNEAQYYLTMFNNNAKNKKADTSYFYKFYVDELAGTYDLVKSFDLPYSAQESSVQEYEGNIITNSAAPAVAGEYDAKGQLIQELMYSLDTYTYRVFKESFKNLWFS